MNSKKAQLARPPELVSQMDKLEMSCGVKTEIRQTTTRKAVVSRPSTRGY